jgi:pyruvate/2-oxoglutarate dehydrogenase complex dihydrolipoamide dehydrogenase (E3) component
MAPRLLMREDPKTSRRSSPALRAEGIRVLTRSPRQAVRGRERREDADRRTRKAATSAILFDAVLVAVGRAANLTGYGLEELGIPTGKTVETNEFLQTRFPNIYAAGDVAGPYQFTHTAAHQAWYAAVNALFDPFKKFKADYAVIPWATFVDPEVARVGLNEQEARAQGIAFEVQHATASTTSTGRSPTARRTVSSRC